MATPSAALQSLIDQKKAATQKGQQTEHVTPVKTLSSSSVVKDGSAPTNTPQKTALEESASNEGLSKIKRMGAREMEEYTSRLDKANFNLKLDLFHCRQRIDSLQEELTQSQEELDHQLTNNEQLLFVQEKLAETIHAQEEQLRDRDRIIEESVAYICEIEQQLALYQNEVVASSRQGVAASAVKPKSDETYAFTQSAFTRPESVASTVSRSSSLETTSQAPTIHGTDLAHWPSLSLLSESSFKTVYGKRQKEIPKKRDFDDESSGLTPIFQVFAPSDLKRKQLAPIESFNFQRQALDTSPNTPELTSGLSTSTDSVNTATGEQIGRPVPQALRHKPVMKGGLPAKPMPKNFNIHQDTNNILPESLFETSSDKVVQDHIEAASKLWPSLSSLRISSYSDESQSVPTRPFDVTNFLFDGKEHFPSGFSSGLGGSHAHNLRQLKSPPENANAIFPIESIAFARHRPRTSPPGNSSAGSEQERSTPTPQDRPASRSGHKRSETTGTIPLTAVSGSSTTSQTQPSRRWLNRTLFRRSVGYHDNQDQLETPANPVQTFTPRSILRSNTNTNDTMKRSLEFQRQFTPAARRESIATVAPEDTYVRPAQSVRRGVKFVNEVSERPLTAQHPETIDQDTSMAEGGSAENKRKWNLTSRRANLKGISEAMRPRALSLTRR